MDFNTHLTLLLGFIFAYGCVSQYCKAMIACAAINAGVPVSIKGKF